MPSPTELTTNSKKKFRGRQRTKRCEALRANDPSLSEAPISPLFSFPPRSIGGTWSAKYESNVGHLLAISQQIAASCYSFFFFLSFHQIRILF